MDDPFLPLVTMFVLVLLLLAGLVGLLKPSFSAEQLLECLEYERWKSVAQIKDMLEEILHKEISLRELNLTLDSLLLRGFIECEPLIVPEQDGSKVAGFRKKRTYPRGGETKKGKPFYPKQLTPTYTGA